jgi:hypothetical protein
VIGPRAYVEILASRLRDGDDTAYESLGVLSTGERIFVCLAAGRLELLTDIHYDRIDEAWRRLDPDWRQAVIRFWESER